jgi:hypothetical protein
VLCLLLLLEVNGVTFEYLPGKKNDVVDILSCLEINELRIEPEEAFTLLPESEDSIIKFPMHSALIFKEQIKAL